MSFISPDSPQDWTLEDPTKEYFYINCHVYLNSRLERFRHSFGEKQKVSNNGTGVKETNFWINISNNSAETEHSDWSIIFFWA